MISAGYRHPERSEGSLVKLQAKKILRCVHDDKDLAGM